ncbi:MAG: ATP-binding protein [Myxococcota bacterium]
MSEALKLSDLVPPDARSRVLSVMVDALFVVDLNGLIIDVPISSAEDYFPGDFGRSSWRTATGALKPTYIWDVMYGEGSDSGVMFEMGYAQLADDLLPMELILDQLPGKLIHNGRTFRIQYRPLTVRGTLAAMVICLDDRTEHLEEDQEHSINREFRRVMTQLMTDLEASRGFFSEMRWLVSQLQPGAETVDLKRTLHTMKGNLGIFGFDSMATFVHQIEDQIIAGDMEGAWCQIGQLRSMWIEKETVYGNFFSSRKDVEITLSREEYEEHVMLLMMQSDYTELLGAAQRWSMDPISQIFARLEMQLKRICSNLGKPVEVVTEDNMVRLPGSGLQPLWASLTHIIRNAADHGFQSLEEREAAGKPGANVFKMAAEMNDESLMISFSDDGRGIDWEKIRAKARQLGISADTPEELTAALFADEVSSSDTVGQLSGRGVGAGAVKAAVEQLEGTITVTSDLGVGTTFVLTIPLASLATLGVLS